MTVCDGEKLLTIAIPAYNVENYIEKLLQTVLWTEMEDEIEILIVNDGSKDGTRALIEEYETKYYSCVKVINKENGGHGSALNCAVAFAKGVFFKAIDGDDWVDTKALKQLLGRLKDLDCDLIITDYKRVFEGTGHEQIVEMSIQENRIFELKEIALRLQGLCYHNICFRTEMLRKANLRLTEHSFYVDNEYLIFSLPHVEKVIYFKNPVYCYRLGRIDQSVSKSSMQKNVMQHRSVLNGLCNWYLSNKSLFNVEINDLVCSLISDVVVFHLNILFSFSLSVKRSKELVGFDNDIKRIPEIYSSMKNISYRVWRKQRYALYPVLWIWLRIKEYKKTDFKK